MANFSYDTLLNDNVKFLQGVQADLNKYLPSSTDAKRGTAIEGAFYLTTNTHRLYVGRKVNDSNSPDYNKVFPVQISAGITTVADSGQLASISTTNAEEGDFYYIENSNVLAVLRIKDNGDKEWVQVNPPSGLTGYNQETVQSNNDVLLNSSITTAATGEGAEKNAKIKFIAGSNVTLTAGTSTDSNNNAIDALTIAATDTSYKLGTEETAGSSGVSDYSASSSYAVGNKVKYSGDIWECKTAIATGGEAWNAAHWTKVSGAIIELRTNGQDNHADNTKISIDGANTVAVTSDTNGNITVSGLSFTNKGVAVDNAATGFALTLEYTDGDGTNKDATHASKSVLDPQITYGVNTAIGGVNQSKSTVHFNSGTATLDIYTKDQTDAAINAAISTGLAGFNAMTYMGTIANADALTALKNAGTAHNGDTYKASADGNLSGITWKKGDLIIVRGNEVNGVVPTANFQFDVVPSGDEPNLEITLASDSAGSYVAAAGSTPESFTSTVATFSDSNNGDAILGKIRFNNTEKIKITSAFNQVHNSSSNTDEDDTKDLHLKIEHRTLTTNITDNNTISTTTGNDTIGNSTVSLFVLPGSSSVTTDGYGHVSAIAGKTITFKHNKLSQFDASYVDAASSIASGSNLISKGQINLVLTDSLGNDTSKQVFFESETLHITPNASTGATAMSVDLKWGSF